MKINRHILDNGLRLVHSQDKSTQMVALNVLYNVGARDEHPEHTGFAHLFEHLMFGGSVNIPDYDMPLQLAGGENNAWTNNDITNYYLTVPRQNVETGFWLESDRMLSLDFSERSLEVQRGVVMEEFKQRCLNQPYGDVGHLLRPLAYRAHTYQWPTIGKDLSHIANATLEEVKAFFFRFYAPNNAVLDKNELLNDSKQLTEKQRYALREVIEKEALAWAVGVVSPEEIDEINILRASFLAMHRAVDQLSVRPQHLLIDGNRFNKYPDIPHTTVIKGDGKYLSIAAASILAKTYRDDYMNRLHEEYPFYDWNKNKGYPTKKHRAAIAEHGTTPYHRMTFNLLGDGQLNLNF